MPRKSFVLHSFPSFYSNNGLNIDSPSPINSSFGSRIDHELLGSMKFQQKIWQRVRFRVKIFRVFVELLDEVRKRSEKSPKLLRFSESTEKKNIIKKATRLMMPGNDMITREIIPFWIVHPNKKFKGIWNVVVLFMLLYSSIFSPFILAFGDSFDQDAIFIAETMISALFFVDFCVNCSTAYYDRNEILVIKRSKIILKYLKGWLLIDFTCWFPFELIFGASGQSSKMLLRLSRIPKLYRLFRISRLMRVFSNNFQHELMEKFQELLNLKSSMVRLLKTFISIIICVHIFSCFWYLSAKLNDFSPETWVVRLNYQDSDVATLYITCLYWTITTLSTCGYGDITPSTKLEQVLAMTWMATGLYFFSFTISNLNSMLSSYDLKENALSSKLAAIDEFASDTNLKLGLRNKLKTSLRYAAEKRGFSWNEKISLIRELPKQLRYEIAINMHQGAAKSLNFFCNKEPSVIAFIVPLLDPIFAEKNCLVYKKGDFADEVYFLVKGNVRITLDLAVVIKSVQKGCYFGDVETLFGYSRNFSAHTTRNCDLLTLNKSAVNEIKDYHFAIWQEMMETAMVRQAQYEKTVIEIKEMEKVFKGTVFTRKTLDEFKESVARILEDRIKVLNKQPEIVTYATVVKKLNELIKVAAMKKFKLDNIDFINDFLLYELLS